MTESSTPTVEAIKEVKLLAHFSDEELAEILSLGEAMECEAHANVMIEGDLSGGLFMLLEGLVGVTKSNPMGGIQYDLGNLHPGSIFGELSLIDNNPRSATVRALVPCKLFHITREKFEIFLGADDSRRLRFYKGCIQTMVLRLRETDSKYVISQYQLWKTALSTRKEAA